MALIIFFCTFKQIKLLKSDKQMCMPREPETFSVLVLVLCDSVILYTYIQHKNLAFQDSAAVLYLSFLSIIPEIYVYSTYIHSIVLFVYV